MRKVLAFLVGLLLLQYQATVHAVPVALTDGTGVGGIADFADFRTDVSGNLHLVWHDAGVDSGSIFYMMFDTAGAVIIDRTQVNDVGTGNTNTRPAVEIDSTGMILVVWEDMTAREVKFMRLDPSQALQDGNPTTQMLIKAIGDVVISAASGNNAAHPRMRIDANGDLHVAWESTSGGDIHYVKIDSDGIVMNVMNSPVLLGSNSSGSDFPDIDVDTSGNVHIVFGNVAPLMSANEVYYAMIDGANSTVLIDATLLTVDDGQRAGQVTVNVDTFDNTLYLVLVQALTAAINGTEEIFLTRLNPALDNQDSSSADPAVLKVSEQKITGSGIFQWHVTSYIGSDKRIHATYIDFDASACAAPYAITDAHITFSGTVLARTSLTTTGSATTCFPQARGAPGLNRIVWTDNSTTIMEIWSDTFGRVDAGSRGFTCSLGNRSATAWTAGDLWLLLGAIACLGVWRRRGFLNVFAP